MHEIIHPILYRTGDVSFVQDGKSYVFRLTISALSELSNTLGADGPITLADKFRSLSADQASTDTVRLIVACLLRPTISPPCSGGAAGMSIVKLDTENIGGVLAAIASVFEASFKGKQTGQNQTTDAHEPERTQWEFLAWFRLAVLHMKLSPTEFWSMPMVEWISLIRPITTNTMSRKVFENLKGKYPDLKITK